MRFYVKFRVEGDLKFLMQDEEFRRRIITAYNSQVGPYNENGFTVRYKGYRIHFDP